jgi:predicted TIM-barrel fold metal-dependent hydrolase
VRNGGIVHSEDTTALQPRSLVDAHHHLLNLQAIEYPWIQRRVPALERLLNNYYDISRDYDVAAYRVDVTDAPVVGSVASEFGAADPLAEAEWVQRCADGHGLPSAFIAAADLTAPTLVDLLARYRDLPVVRAVRQPLYWAADPLRRLGSRPDYLSDPTWLRGFERVAAVGLVWDLLLYDEQLPLAHELLRSFPDTPIVLEAIGWPLDQGHEGFKRWRERLEAISQYPNLTLKFQGLALLFAPSTERLRPWVRTAVDIFGPARCMFASHFPVDRLLWSFRDLLSCANAIVSDLSTDDRASFFSGCASRVYRL